MTLYPQHNNTMVACTLVVDCSGSMSANVPNTSNFTRMDALKAGIDVFIQDINEDDMAPTNSEISVISIGGKGGDKPLLIADWTLGRDFQKPDLKPNGTTPLGESLLLALEITNNRKLQYRQDGISYVRPWIILLTDGQPTDSQKIWQEAVQAAHEADRNKAALILGVGIDGCPLAKLQELTSSNFPPLELSSHRFKEFFLWLSSSISATSESIGSGRGIDSQGGEQLCSTDPWRTV